jgi:hypothetical protein
LQRIVAELKNVFEYSLRFHHFLILEGSMARIIKLADVYERQIGTQVNKKVYSADKHYFKELDRILDELFEEAAAKGMEWKDLAAKSGLAIQTVVNLGERWTKRPQYRTVCLIAAALDRRIELKDTSRKAQHSLRIAKVG